MNINSSYLHYINKKIDFGIKKINSFPKSLTITLLALTVLGGLKFIYSQKIHWNQQHSQTRELTNNLKETLSHLIETKTPQEVLSILKNYLFEGEKKTFRSFIDEEKLYLKSKRELISTEEKSSLKKKNFTEADWLDLLSVESTEEFEKLLVRTASAIMVTRNTLNLEDMMLQAPSDKLAMWMSNGARRINQFVGYWQPSKRSAPFLQSIEANPKAYSGLLLSFLMPSFLHYGWQNLSPLINHKLNFILDIFASILGTQGKTPIASSNIKSAEKLTKNKQSLFAKIEKNLGGKTTLIAAGVSLVALYYLANQTMMNGVTDVIHEMEFKKIPQRGLDFLPSYQTFLREIKNSLLIPKGLNHSNLLIWHPQNNFTLFNHEIVDGLAEIMLTGRASDYELPQMKIWRLDALAFFYHCHDENDLFNQWMRLVSRIKSQGDLLLHIQNSNVFIEHALFGSNNSQNDGREKKANKFGSLMLESMIKGDIRGIFTIDEGLKERFVSSESYKLLFRTFPIRPLSIEETGKLLTHIFNPIDDWKFPRLKPKHIESLLDIVEEFDQIHSLPKSLIDLAEHAICHSDIILKGTPVKVQALENKFNKSNEEIKQLAQLKIELGEDKKLLEKIAEAGQKLDQARKLKEKLLANWWKIRRNLKGKMTPYLVEKAKELLLLYYVLIPIYTQSVKKLQQQLKVMPYQLDEQELILQFQRQVKNLLSPALSVEKEKLSLLPSKLGGKITGHEFALKSICDSILNWRIAPHDSQKPGLVLLFAGPAGYGKSETATLLARNLQQIYGLETNPKPEINILRLFMTKARESDEGTSFFELIKRQIVQYPVSVIILEEFEKVSPKIAQKCLEFFGETPMYSSQSRHDREKGQSGVIEQEQEINRRNIIFILTTNLADKELSDPSYSESLEKFEQAQEIVKNHIKEKYQAPFLERISCIVPFARTTKVNIYPSLDKIKKDLNKQKCIFSYDQKVIDYFEQNFVKSKISIRQLKDLIRTQVTTVLNPHILQRIRNPNVWKAHLKVNDEKLILEISENELKKSAK